jgi:hypothetical protein
MRKGTQHSEETKQRIAEKMQGNDNAEVWDVENTLNVINDINHELTHNENEYTLSGALLAVGLYADWWSDMKNKFSNEESVIRAIKRTESFIEKRIVNNTMTGDAKSATFSIFLLKNKFGYVDKQETDNVHKVTGIDLKSAIKFTDGDNAE